MDRGHLHSHLIVNSVHPTDGRKLRSEMDALVKPRKLSDEICRTHGFSTRETYERSDLSIYKDWNEDLLNDNLKCEIEKVFCEPYADYKDINRTTAELITSTAPMMEIMP